MSSLMECLSHLEKKLTLLKNTPPPLPPVLKNEVPFQEIFTRKRIQILHFINMCLISKATLEKVGSYSSKASVLT